MDQNAPRPEFRLESLQLAEYLPTASYNSEHAAHLAWQERGSLGLAWNETFREADQQPYDWGMMDQELFSEKRFGSDAQAFQMFWKNILEGLKSSDAVNHLRKMKGLVDSEQEMQGAFRGFEHSVARAFRITPLSEHQRNHFREVWGERDFGLARMAVEMAGQLEAAREAGVEFDDEGMPVDFELKHHPFESLLIAQPKLRPMDYWETKDARGYLRRFGDLEVSEVARSQMKSDLDNLADSARRAA